jgi:hypothetical protein
MKKVILLLSLIILAFQSIGQTKTKIDTLKNATIIKLTKAKLTETVIIQKINKSVCYFDASTDALITLRENNVSDKVIELMIAKQEEQESQQSSQVSNNSTDKKYSFAESGIYFYEDEKYTKLDPTNISGTNMSPAIMYAPASYTTKIDGDEANYQLTETMPTFYFNFDPAHKSLNNANQKTNTDNYMDYILSLQNGGKGQAVSPNDFKLVKLDKRKGVRQFNSGSIGAFGASTSIPGKYIVTFKYEKVSGNTYKIIFKEALKPGEYCFMYSGNYQTFNQSGSGIKIFDFGITK